MKKIIFLFFFLFTPLCVYAQEETGKVITVRADKWCPYNCDAFMERRGYMIDVAKAIFAQLGYTIDYQTLNWDESVNNTREGKFTAVVGATQAEGQGLIFPMEPLGISRYVFLVNKDDTWTYENLSSLEGKKLGLMQGFVYSEGIQNFVDGHLDRVQYFSADNDIQLRLWVLINKNIDVLIEDENVVKYALMTLGLSDKFKIAGYDDTLFPVYMAFSPKDPQAPLYATIVSRGINDLRASGKLSSILNVYGLQDWKN